MAWQVVGRLKPMVAKLVRLVNRGKPQEVRDQIVFIVDSSVAEDLDHFRSRYIVTNPAIEIAQSIVLRAESTGSAATGLSPVNNSEKSRTPGFRLLSLGMRHARFNITLFEPSEECEAAL